MAMRKRGSRRIVVDGAAYRWRIRRRATLCQADYGNGTLHVGVESADRRGSVLVLLTDRLHPSGWAWEEIVAVTPGDVAGWIRAAIDAGWEPIRPGPPIVLRVAGADLLPVR